MTTRNALSVERVGIFHESVHLVEAEVVVAARTASNVGRKDIFHESVQMQTREGKAEE